MLKVMFIIMIAALTVGLSVTMGATNAKSIIGQWKFANDGTTVEIYERNGAFHGRLIDGKLIKRDDGTSMKDMFNEVPDLRARDLVGLKFLQNLKHKNGEWQNGNIYDPHEGDSHRCYAWIEDGFLKIRAYDFIGLFGHTLELEKV